MGGAAKAVTSGISNGIQNVTHGISHGNINEIESGYKQYGGAAIRGAAGVATFGTSELANQALGGRLFGNGSKSNGPSQAGYTDNPAQTLAMTGGAPLLANIALGANVKDTIAGYFGSGNYDDLYKNSSPEDQQLLDGVTKQLTSIQTNTDLKNKAVQQVVNDFPNVVAHAAQARQDAGQEFDDTTKAYLDKALNTSAAKYAANGSLSSGAMDAAAARVGADYGMQKLDYQNNRESTDYNQGVTGWQARYNETNSLRSFQNLMTQGAAGNGFSAVQNMLGRTQQTNMANAGFANQKSMQDQANNNALLGSIGQLGGTLIGGAFGGPAGAGIGGTIGRMTASGAATGGANNTSMGGMSDPNPLNNW